MDNASYHSRLKEKILTSNFRKNDILEWLLKKNMAHNPLQTISELLEIIKDGDKYNKYV